MSTKLCQNGHVMEASWDRCPYCPDPSRGARPAVPPTRVAAAAMEPAPPPPMPIPTPAPAPVKAAAKTRLLTVEAEAPLVGWLVALNGKHKGTDFRLREGKTAIGSDSGKVDITLEDDFISGQHATIKFVNKDGERIFILTDLDSANGTFLNDSPERIAREELVDNDTVVFGQTKMKFKCL